MDIELSFRERKAAEAFMQEYHQSRLYGQDFAAGANHLPAPQTDTNALPDWFIEERIITLATEAADFEIRREPGRIVIWTQYVQRVELPLFVREFTFSPRAEAPR